MSAGSVKITILVDNRAGKGLAKEHGFSLWIEADGKRILFDTGQGPVLESNARALGVDLSETEFLVLSHGHYDHTGGIAHALRLAPEARVLCHPGIVKPRFILQNGSARAIEIPAESMKALASLPEHRINRLLNPVSLSEKIGVAVPIPRITEYEDTGGAFYLDPNGDSPDPIEDDLALWIKTEDGIIVCVGCSHAGLINSLRYVQEKSGVKKLRAVIGGFHLLNAGSGRIEKTLSALRILDPIKIIPCHCTGEPAMNAILDAFRERTTPGSAGMMLRF